MRITEKQREAVSFLFQASAMGLFAVNEWKAPIEGSDYSDLFKGMLKALHDIGFTNKMISKELEELHTGIEKMSKS